MMQIDPPGLFIDNNEIKLGPIQFCYYRYFLEKAKSGEKYMRVTAYQLPLEFTESIIEYYKNSYPPDYDINIKDYKKELKESVNINTDNFLPNVSKINKKIKEVLNNSSKSRYCSIESEGPRGAKTYGINLPKEKIKFLK